MAHNQFLYCFKTTVEINKKFDKTGVNKKHEDYAVYKIGKTTQELDSRMKQHGDVVDTIMFKYKVYDCNTLERDLIDLLKKSDKLVHRKNLGTLKDADGVSVKSKKRGLEYFEGRYSDIKPILEYIVSEETQNCKSRDMDLDLTCQICSRTFGDNGGLKRHMHVHESGKKETGYRRNYKKDEEKVFREPSKRIREQSRIVSYEEKSLSTSSKSSVKSSPKILPVKALSPKSPQAKSLLPKSLPVKLYNRRAITAPVYMNDVKKNKSLIYTDDYNKELVLSKSFLELFDNLKIKNAKRKRSKSKSSSKRPLKKVKIMT